MKTIILGGGSGTRLGVVTSVVNKHLLPVANVNGIDDGMPMISHSLSIALQLKLRDILIVTNPESIGQFAKLFSQPIEPFNLIRPYLTAQTNPRGIADAISCGEYYSNNGPVFVILGDNIFHHEDVFRIVRTISGLKKRPISGAHIWCKQVENPQDYGVLEFSGQKVIDIHEKPKVPPSNYAVTGIYVFDHNVWSIIKGLTLSERGEFEVTDIIREYLIRDSLHMHLLSESWYDLGRSIKDYFYRTIR